MTAPGHAERMLAYAAERDRWAADARREAERCAARHDDKGTQEWTERAIVFEGSAAWWRGNAATFDRRIA